MQRPSTGGGSPGAGAGQAAPAGRGRRGRRAPDLFAAAAELALVAVTLAAVAGLTRLFAGRDFLAPVVAAALAGHVIASACRRFGVKAPAAAAMSGLGLVLFVAWVVEPHTTTFGLPGPATWQAVASDLRSAVTSFGEVKAPVAATPGFVLACVVGTWLAAWLADMFAFRLRARFEALVPTFTILLFGAMLGTGRSRVTVAALYLAAVLAFVVLADLRSSSAPEAWFGARQAEGQGAVLRSAAVVGLVAVATGALLGPRLPGAESSGLFGMGPGPRQPRVTVSPLVDIRGRLVDQSDVEAFVVSSAEPAYWRLTSLENFDGTIWSSRGIYQGVRRALEPGPHTTGAADDLRQEFAIGALSSIWLPAAFRPAAVPQHVAGMRYERDSASLLTDKDTGDGLRYTVLSEVPRFTEAELATASNGVPQAIAERYLELPGTFPSGAADLALQATAGETTAFAKALALQNWFRDNFTYSLDVPPGHGNDAIVRFLAERKGYCEQFAGSYAAMARSVGLPARVAVGFTPGVADAEGRFHVTGRQAHAWPEVYIAGYGWVPFEPTPGRSPPGGDYTGTAAGGGDQAGVPPDAAPAPPPTTAPSPDAPAAPTTAAPAAPEQPSGTPVGGSSGLERAAVGLLATLAVAAVVASVPVARRARTKRRRAGATTPSEQVLVAWDEAEEDLTVTGLPRLGHETTTEYAGRVGPVAGSAVAAPLEWLATGAEAASWSRAGVSPDVASRAVRAPAAIATALRAGASWWRRARWALDPRPLLRRTTRR